MSEQLIPEQFVNEFFIEITKSYKHPRSIKHHEHKERHAHKISASIDSLSQEAQDIQILEEKPISPPVPIPSLIPESRSLGTIALPNPPSFSSIQAIHVPVPMTSIQNFLDLGRLNALINDPNVTLIQCDGPGTQIRINRKNKTESTSIKLIEREVQSILNKFSQRARVPLTEPVFKAQISQWQITAVISPVNMRFVMVRK